MATAHQVGETGPSGESATSGALTLRVVTPEGSIFDGAVDSVVVPSHDGETAFMKGHAPFVGLLGEGELRFHGAGAPEQHYYLGGGVVQVVHDVVTVLAEAVTPVRSLDAAKAQADLSTAVAARATTDEQIAARARAIAAARAKIRLASRTPAAHG